MSLEKYKKKRDLTKSREPGGQSVQKGKELIFVVQKHAAFHLHYDFRLELDGVLKSWAIPKGPSLDPSIKRLAMEVEDHPYDYKDFEGIIPRGNYGAGQVIIWDEGSYTAAVPGNDEEQLRTGYKKGDLKFILNGNKLKGEFALVRIRSAGDNSWLLIKKHDEYASDRDILFEDQSVRSSQRIIEKAAKQAPAVPPETPPERVPVKNKASEASDFETSGGSKIVRSSRPEKEMRRRSSVTSHKTDLEDGGEMAVLQPPAADPMPHGITPMLATPAKDPFDAEDWIFEIKLDGYRTITEIEQGRVELYSRKNLSFTETFAAIIPPLQVLGHDAVLDGEVVVLDNQGKADFQLLQNYRRNGQGSLFYYVFDLIYLDGRDLRNLPLIKRKEMLAAILPEPGAVRYCDHIAREGRAFFELAQKSNLEGIVAKRADSVYQTGRRTKDWLKIKIKQQQEAIICGYTEPRGGRKWFGALVLGVYENGNLTYIGLSGGGFDEASLKQIHAMLQPLVRPKSPFSQQIRISGKITWVNPVLVCEVSFTEWTGERLMRHPIFLGLREDKAPETVVREIPEVIVQQEEPQAEPGGQKEPEVKKNEKIVTIGGHRIKLSNLDKIFWPTEGYTKGDVIDYYRRMAGYILPYLKDRPESLYRTPGGINEEGFFQKEAGVLPPKWMQTKEIFSRHIDKNVKYFICQDEATLVYIANLGCIEINPWLSRIQNLDQPDYLVIDLDPEDIGFDKVIETALAVHEVLEKAGAASFPKTSGATGMHIFVPLEAKYDYDTAVKFAQLVAVLVNNQLPGFTSVARMPEKRQKKVYLDFLQNRAGQTLAAPYSIRVRPGATVSTPLQWEEVRPGLDPREFTMINIEARLAKTGDLFKGVLGPGIDINDCIERLENAF